MTNNRSLGCLSISGLLATLVTLLVIGAFAVTSGNAMFNPGALNAEAGRVLGGVRSHAEIGNRCELCHAAPWAAETMSERCVDCHADIAAEMRDKTTTLHGALAYDASGKNCLQCHSEHLGPSAAITDMDVNAFPHEAVGFSLTGHRFNVAREPFECSDCHRDKLSSFDPGICQTCHARVDIVFATTHSLAFGTDCLACHDGWDRFGDDFSHNAFSFPLSGKHAEVTCAQCHPNARTISDLQSSLQDCASCHSPDAHDGRFGQDCATCHTAEGWRPARFDHSLSAFRLEGEHAEAACEDCHQNGVYKGTPTDCYSCHWQQDEHDGRFGANCSACHTTEDWDQVVFDHNLSNFPLLGAHVELACERCHTAAQFAGLATACAACHAEPQAHLGQFGTDCALCHTTMAWSPAGYSGAHTFPINHEGANGTCRTCHPSNLTTYTCYGCHKHNEAKVRSKHLKEGISDFQNCVGCHPTGREHEGGREGGEGGEGGEGDDD